MDPKIMEQILDELFSSLEALETRSAALLQLVKDKRLASDEELASCLEQAGNASSVRWRAARARINYLLSTVLNAPEPVAEKKPAQTADPEPADDTTVEPNAGKKDGDSPSSDEKMVGDAPGSASQSTEKSEEKDAA
jgi:hypothetical protein